MEEKKQGGGAATLRHVFVVNPAAGKGGTEAFVRSAAEKALAPLRIPYELRVTKAPMDAADIARELARSGEKIRLYACGGDGTLGEVANGAAGFANVSVAPVPVGSGNDFVKTYGGEARFLDLAALAQGEEHAIDLIDTGGRLSVNLCSAGFDSAVAIRVARFKTLPLVTGALAYQMAVLYGLLHGMRNRFTLRIDGGEPVTGDLLLVVVGNGKFYGGGYMAAADAVPDDGLLDFVTSDTVSRLTFLRMVDGYRKGAHALLPMVHHRSGRELELSAPQPFPVSLDGEVVVRDRVTFRVVPSALRIVLPAGARLCQKP